MQAVENFRVNVRTAMSHRELSQEDLAAKAQMGRPFLNRLLQGKQKPSLDVCDRIGDALGISVSDLVAPPKKFLKSLPKAIAT